MNKRRRPGRLRRNPLSSRSNLTSKGKKFSFEPLEIRTLLSGISLAGVPDWVEQGPRPMINNGNTVIPPNNPAAGAVEGIAINPNPNPDGTSQVFLATVNGGVWRSDNLSTTNPSSTTWTPLTDQLGFMGTSSIAFSRLDASEKTLFVGSTSLSAYGDADSAGLGVLRTTDGGNTWQSFAVSANEPEVKTVLPTAINLASSGPVQEMVLVGGINPQGGLYRSDNNGQTFSLLSGANGLPVGQVTQLIADPGNAQRFYAALPGLGVYEGDFNAGTKVITWTAFNTNIPAAAISASKDVQITAADVGGTTELYVAMADSTSAITGVYRSSDTSANWTSLGAPAGLVAGNLNQHAFNLVGDPTDNQVVYIAGLGTIGPNGAIFRYDTSSASWVNITGAGANNTQPHPDSRDMVFLGSNDLLESSDGGLYLLPDPQNAAASSWASLNGEGTAGQGLGVNEFHDIAWDSNSNVIMAGAQDNGAGYSQPINLNSSQISGGVWTDVNAGDGGDVAVDNYTLASQGFSIRYSSSQGNSTPPLDALTRRAFDANGVAAGPLQVIEPNGLAGFQGLFITPTVLDSVAPTLAQLAAGQSTRMVIGGYQSANPVYESNNVGSALPANITWSAVPVDPTFGDTVTALAYGGMLNGVANADVLYAGGSKFVGNNQVFTGLFVRTAAGGTLSPTASPFPGTEVRSIALDPTNWQHAFVISKNGVWETTDAGGTWTPRTGDLVNGNLRSVEYVHLATGDVVLVGGQGGIYRMFLNNPGVWTKLGANLPNNIAYDVDYNAVSDVLVVGTFGRGAWTISQASTVLSTPPILTVSGDNVAGQNDNIRLVLDANNPLLLDVFINNNSTTPDEQIPLASLQQINVDGLGGNDTLIVDDSNGLINVPGGIHYDGGAGFNTLQIVGGAMQTTDVYSVGPNNGEGSDVITGAGGVQTIDFQNLAPVLDTVPAATATVNGTPANNAITYSIGSVPANGLVTIDNQESYEFSNKTNLIINSGAGDDTVNLNNPGATPTGLASIAVNGTAGATDNVTVNGTAAANAFGFQPTSSTSAIVTLAGEPAMTLSKVSSVSINGQNGADVLTYTTTAVQATVIELTPGATVNSGAITGRVSSVGGPGPAVLPLSYSNIDRIGGLIFAHTGGPAIDDLTIDGTGGNDVINVVGGFVSMSQSSIANPLTLLATQTPGVLNVTFNEVNGGDSTFNLTAPLPYTGATSINASGAADPPVVNLTGNGTAINVNLGGTTPSVTGGGLGTVNLSGVGIVNVIAAVAAVTVADANSHANLAVTPTGASSATVQADGGGIVVNVSNAALSGLVVSLPGGTKTLTVDGTAGNDGVNVARAATTTVTVNGFLPVMATAADLSALVINTGLGTDTVGVTDSAGVLPPLTIIGGQTPASVTLNVTPTAGTTGIFPGPAPDAGSVSTPGGTINYSRVAVVTVTGTGADTLHVFGTTGSDIIADDETSVAVNNDAPIGYTGFANVDIFGQSGNDTLVLDGSAAPDSVTYSPKVSDSTVAGLGAAITFNDITNLVYNGQGGNDTLTVTTPAGADTVTYTPGGARDAGSVSVGALTPVSFSKLGATGSVSLGNTGAIPRQDTLVYNGTAANDNFTVDAGSGAIHLLNHIDLATPGITNLTLNDVTGENTYTISATAGNSQPYASINVNGSGSSDPDVLTLNGDGTPVIVNLGGPNPSVTGGGLGTVNLTGVGTLNLNDGAGAVTVDGTAASDAFNVTPTSATSAIIQANGAVPILNLTGGSLLVDPLGGSNSVTVNGTNGNDVFNVSDSVVQVVGLLPVSLATADVGAIYVSGLAGNDIFNVTPSATVPISVDGGDPVGVNPPLSPPNGDQININAGGSSVAYSQGPTADSGGFVVGADRPVSFIRVERATVSNPGPVTVNGTNEDDTITVTAIDGLNEAQYGAVGADGVQDFAVQISDGITIAYVNSSTLNINTLAGNDTVVIQAPAPGNENWNVTVNVDGGAPTAGNGSLGDTVSVETLGSVPQTVNYTPSSASGGTVALPTITTTVSLTNIEHLTIAGNGNNDPLTVSGTAGNDSINATPGSTTDSGYIQVNNLLGVTYQALGAAGGVTIAGNGGADSLTVNGTPANDSFMVDAGSGTVHLNNQRPLTTIGITTLTLNGLAGDNSYTISATAVSPQPYTTINVNGSGLTDPDVLNLFGDGMQVNASLGTTSPSVTGGGLGIVDVSGVAVVNLDDTNAGIALIQGTSHADTFDVTPTGTNTATFQVDAALPVLNLTTGTVNVNDNNAGDQTIVHGTGSDDTIDVIRNGTTSVSVNGSLLIGVPAFALTPTNLTVATGAGTDTINVTGAAPTTLTLIVLGGQTPAADTLKVTSTATAGDTTYSPGATNDSGSLSNADGLINFGGIKVVNDTAGAATDTLTVNGTNGNDTITAAHTAAGNLAWVNAQAPIAFTGFGTLALNGRFGNDSFVVSPVGLTGLTTIKVIGNAGANNALTVNGSTAADTINYSPTAPGAGTVATVGSPTVTMTNMASLAINGQGGGDALTVTTPAGADTITYSPGATVDSAAVQVGSLVPMSFNNLGAGSVKLADTGGSADTLVYNGTAASDTFNVTGGAGGMIGLNGQLSVTTPGVANLKLLGSAGDDTFNLTGGLPYTTTTLDGGEPSASDIANFTGATGAVAVNLGDSAATPPTNSTVTGYGGIVTLIGVEVANLDAGGNTLTANGTAHNDSVTYTPSGAAAGSFNNAGLNTTFNFTAATSTFTINGGGGNANQVNLKGDPGRDLFVIREDLRKASVTDASGTLLEPVILGPTVQILSAFGIGGQNTFQVTPAVGTQFAPTGNLDNLLVNVDGGNSGQNNALVIQAAGGGPLAANQFVVNDRGVIDNSGTVRTFTAAVQWPDINYTNIKVVSPNVAGTSLNPNLLVMGPDLYEPNDQQGNSAFLGSGAAVNLQNATIFATSSEFPGVPADQDYYRVVAQTTGTLDFQVYFRTFDPALLPGGGNLNLQVLDAGGNVIATASGGPAQFGADPGTGNARIRIPAVAGQSYFLHVYGATLPGGAANGAVVNGYNLTVSNTAPPTPFNVELSRSVPAGVAGSPDTGDLPPGAPGDDTGRSQLDNVTKDNTPRIYLRLSDGVLLNDLPGNGTTDTPPAGVIPIPFSPNATTAGFRVAIFDGNNTQTPVGFATQVAGFPGLYSFDFPTALADGVHHLTAEVQMVDPSAAKQTGFGATSVSLDITVDTVPPPIAFGTGVAGSNTGLDGTSDSGVGGQQPTMVDRITNVSTPTLYGVAEANSVVRLYDDVNNDGVVDAGDVFLGQATAVPTDGTNALPGGQWRITSNVDLNSSKLGFPLDGLRNLLLTGEDLAGNVSAAKALSIFIDTQGAKVNNVSITGSPAYNLFLNKPAEPTPTPLVNALDVTFNDQPVRVGPDFVYPAVNPTLAATVGNYYLVGEHTGPIAITSVTFADSTASGTPGMSVATLHFAAPLPDDRYTLTVSDHITDNAGNALDGEFNGATFPSGNGAPGGTFVGAFTVDSRPEVGVFSSGTVSLDINGDGTFDPQNPDANNRDAVLAMGFPTDRLIAGQFSSTYSTGAAPVVNGFDKLAAYGQDSSGQWRWLYDLSGLGKTATAVAEPIPIDGLPVAGNLDGVAADGAQVGLFDGHAWYLDVLNQGYISAADIATGATAAHPAGMLPSDMVGLPIVGDFDHDGHFDLATYQQGVMEFDLSSLDAGGIVTGQWNAKLDLASLLPASIGFNTTTARPVAADMDADGQTDFGLYLPERTDSNPGTGQWYFFESDFGHTPPDALSALTSTAALPAGSPFLNLVHHFEDPALGGHDSVAQFGDQFALPVVGNFDPPDSSSTAAAGLTNSSSTTDVANWVARLYTQILGREPGTGELTHWVTEVNQGMTPTQVAQIFVTNGEYRANVINQLYQQYLGRAADASGIAWWTAVWSSSGGPEQVQAGIIGSPEYYATAGKQYPNLSPDAAWLTALYHDLLNRDVDPAGLAYWTSYIQTHSNQSVVMRFVTGDEYRLNLVGGWFQTYLGRQLDSGSGQALLHSMQSGMTQDQLLITLLASDEYRNGT